ncbi:argonaute/piwi family protein [Hwanghaeella sp.]|uniref:argonaute/piwi family protein n=1 Tax=Hwanghaeella sp. TaxID=2605943 RepID=UPI003CCC0955
MTISHTLIAEPELEFGDGGKHVDPRIGLHRHGPLQPILGDRISIGVIGTAETVDGFEQFLERLKSGIEGKSTKQPNLFPPFPGLGNDNPFRCEFEVQRGSTRVLPVRDVGKLVSIKAQNEAVTESVDVFVDQATAMLESTNKPDVIVAALPMDLICKIKNGVGDEGREDDARSLYDGPDFRDLLKAETMHLEKPTQIVWPTLWDDHARIPRKLKDNVRKVQDPATRAWNLLNGIFYKAGRVPWRLPRPEDQLKTSYVGIGFFKDSSGQRLLTSTAQMFDERGKGLILRGGRARIDKGDRHPYLDRNDAYDLMRRSLKAFFSQHHHYPARIIVLKTSRFETDEADGFLEALAEVNIAYTDLIWVQENSPISMYRAGDYPPLRGTVINLGRDAVLFTRGSNPVYRTYPGLRSPNPLLLRPHINDTPITEIADEILALTKMNWNTTQFDGALPIPIHAARKVGKVLKHVPEGQRAASDYTRYM